MSEPLEKQVVRAAYRLLRNRNHWTSGVLARDAAGAECEPTSPLAVQWCMRGALIKTARLLVADDRQAHELASRCEKALGLADVPAFNDRTGPMHVQRKLWNLMWKL